MPLPPDSPYRDQFRPWEPVKRVFSAGPQLLDGDTVKVLSFEQRQALSTDAADEANLIITCMTL